MAVKRWKRHELKVARSLGTERNPLSGITSRHTGSDTLHKKLFIETKSRIRHSILTVWRKAKEQAIKEDKIPVVALVEKGRHGYWLLIHQEDLKKVLEELE